MDKLKELLTYDPCYEQHIVSIKKIYEDNLFGILIPAIYEGFQTTYNKSYEFEQKTIHASKKNRNIVNCGILALFQKCIKDIPNLSVHRLRSETERIKTSSKSSDIFDDLIKAVCKANIILLTYNVDHKRHELMHTKYHENIIIHDFIHNCYINSAKIFYTRPELFYHINEPHIINQNKRACYKVINKAIKEAIISMLPMKELLLEYTKQPYMQKEPIQINNTDDIMMSQSALNNKTESNIVVSNEELYNSPKQTLLISENQKIKNPSPILEIDKQYVPQIQQKPENKMKVVNVGYTKGPVKSFFREIDPVVKNKMKEYDNPKQDIIITRSDVYVDKELPNNIEPNITQNNNNITPVNDVVNLTPVNNVVKVSPAKLSDKDLMNNLLKI